MRIQIVWWFLSRSASDLDELKSICWTPLAVPNLRQFYSQGCPKLPEANTESFRHVERVESV